MTNLPLHGIASGTLYGVGVGPGDPELMTVKAVRILKSVPIIVAPMAEGVRESMALEIARCYIEESRQEIIGVEFPIGLGAPPEAAWEGASVRIEGMLDQGNDVAFLTEGDAMVYSSFSYVMERLKTNRPDLRIEVIPAVTSITAAAASAQRPLVSHGERLAVWPALYGIDDLQNAIESYDTVVLMKVNRQALESVSRMRRKGVVRRAVLVKRATTTSEKVITDLKNVSPDEAEYFSMLIISKKDAH